MPLSVPNNDKLNFTWFSQKKYTILLIFSSPLMHFSFKSPPKLMLQQILDFEYDANGSFCVNMPSLPSLTANTKHNDREVWKKTFGRVNFT